MKIQLTEFSERHFQNIFGGTKILDKTKEEFEAELNSYFNGNGGWITEGYAPFCKLFCLENNTDAKTGTLPITIGNYHYLRSGYSSRTKNELPVFSRWFEIPRMFIPKAEYLMVVLYSREQLYQEYLENLPEDDETKVSFELDIDTDYGVVAILGQMSNEEEPMKPITMMRNALGREEGGSGVDLDREAYKSSVEFWEKNATVK